MHDSLLAIERLLRAQVNIRRSKIWESEKQKLLGILRDWNLCFDEYVCRIAKKLPEN